MNYEEVGAEIGRLVSSKQTSYGDSHGRSGEVLKVLFPKGIPVDKLDDALTITRMVDKLFRIANDAHALGEDAWMDLAGYSILGLVRNRKEAFYSTVSYVDIRPAKP